MKGCTIVILTALLAAGTIARAGEKIRCKVVYMSSSVIYLNAGRDAGFIVGDTAEAFRNFRNIGKVQITAISKNTSAAKLLTPSANIAVGDSIVSIKVFTPVISSSPASVAAVNETTSAVSPARVRMKSDLSRNDRNVITGRAAIQYISMLSSDSRFNLSQPAPLLRLDVRNLYGTGMVFSMYGRSYYDLTDRYLRSGEKSPLKIRMYEFQLQYNDRQASIGYGFGRMNSSFVAGMGMFDGGQVYARGGYFTGGVLFGAGIFDQSLNINRDYRKGALFINYRSSENFTQYFDGTIAYIRQLMRDKLDREYFYLQNSMSLGSQLSIYENTELDLNDISGGKRRSALKLSNTFLSVNYYPLAWLNTNIGYDGTRSIYLFESMKSISDTLLDKNLQQGIRAGATVQLPYFIYLSGGIFYRAKKGDVRDSKTLNGALRASNLFGSDVNAGIRYAKINGLYSDGYDITFDVDQTFFYKMTASLRYDYYAYSILSLHQAFITRTVSATINYRISGMWYMSLFADTVRDETMNNVNIFAEVGVRF
jgi:hypothetical protein